MTAVLPRHTRLPSISLPKDNRLAAGVLADISVAANRSSPRIAWRRIELAKEISMDYEAIYRGVNFVPDEPVCPVQNRRPTLPPIDTVLEGSG